MVSWLQFNRTDGLFQAGVFDTLSVSHDMRGDVSRIHAPISFSSPFAFPPKVFVGLTGWSLKDQHCRLQVYATDIDETGFTIKFETWNPQGIRPSDRNNAQAQWIAFPSKAHGISVGTFEGLHSENFKGTVTFDTAFDRQPKIFTALTNFDWQFGSWNYANSVLLKTYDVGPQSMAWAFEARHYTEEQLPDLKIGGAFLALDI